MEARRPQFFGGETRMDIIIALARYGAMTSAELLEATGISRRSFARNNQWLREHGIVVTYPWANVYQRPRKLCSKGGRRRPQRPLNTPVYELDRRHPWYGSIHALGYRLGNAFPLPDPKPDRKFRKRRGPQGPIGKPPATPPFPLYGQESGHVLMMYLAHTKDGIQLRKLAGLTGLNRGALSSAADLLEDYGIIESFRTTSSLGSQERRIRLRHAFPAYQALLTLAIKMDKQYGRQFEAIALSHKKREGINAVRRYWAKWAGRKITDRPWLKHQ